MTIKNRFAEGWNAGYSRGVEDAMKLKIGNKEYECTGQGSSYIGAG